MSLATVLTADDAAPLAVAPVLTLARPRALQRRVAETVTAAYASLGCAGQPALAAPEAQLAAAEDAVLDALVAGRRPGARRCRALLSELRVTREELAGAHATQLLERQVAVRAALGRLRTATELPRMLRQVAAELCRCGFGRAWVVRLSDSAWQLAAVHVTDGPAVMPARAAEALTPGSNEAEMIRRRCALVAAGEACEPALAAVLGGRSYVTAPILVDSRVVGFVGADASRAMGDGDRETLALFAEALGPALQRVVLLERLEGLRADVRRLTASLGDMVDDTCWAAIDLAAQPQDAPPRLAAPAAGGRESRLASLLTPRELEVLRLMAAGETNSGIAGQLVISEGTVKSHVKHILRKLHASNRAQAVSRYLRLVHAGPRPS